MSVGELIADAVTAGIARVSLAKLEAEYVDCLLGGKLPAEEIVEKLGADPAEDARNLAARRRAAEQLDEAARLRRQLAEARAKPSISGSTRLGDLGDLTLAELGDAWEELKDPRYFSARRRREHDLESSASSLESEARAVLQQSCRLDVLDRLAAAHGKRSEINRLRNERAPIAAGKEVLEVEAQLCELEAGRGAALRQPGEDRATAIRRLRRELPLLKDRKAKAVARLTELAAEAERTAAALAAVEGEVWQVENLRWSFHPEPEGGAVSIIPNPGLAGTGPILQRERLVI